MFLYRLARLLCKSVFEIKHTISNKEMIGWYKYLSKEPSNSIEAQLALQSQISANSFGAKMTFDEAFFTNYKVEKKQSEEIKPMTTSEIRGAFSNLL